jgi:hypothetical protein
MARTQLPLALGILVHLCAFAPDTVAGKKDPDAVPKEVRALEGAYTGSWAMYGIDDKGAVVKRMAWTDTMSFHVRRRAVGVEASGPCVNAGGRLAC